MGASSSAHRCLRMSYRLSEIASPDTKEQPDTTTQGYILSLYGKPARACHGSLAVKPRKGPPFVAIGRPVLQLISGRRARLARPVGKEIGRRPRSASSDFRGRRTPCIVEK